MEKRVWDQLRNKTAQDLIKALEKDGWERKKKRGAVLSFKHPVSNKVVTIHYHPKKAYSPKMLKDILEHIDWNNSDLRRLKLIR